MKVYIIIGTKLVQNINFIYGVYSNKELAKRVVDGLNDIENYEETIYNIQSYEVIENEPDYFANSTVDY